MTTENIYIKACSYIKNAKNILIVTHDRPDGDAVASVCLLAELLNQMIKPFDIFCLDQPQQQFSFLPHLEKFKTVLTSFAYALIIVVDCGGLNRTNLVKQITNRSKDQLVIEFDHHPKVNDYADLEIRNPEAAATSEILYSFLKANKIKLNKNMATCILTGIITDTANFLYPSTSSTSINIASEMLGLGARLPQIVENTWRNKNIAIMKTWGKAMSNLYLNEKLNFAITILSPSDISEEISEEDLDGMAGFLSNLHNVKGILLLKEQKNGLIRGSLRTARPGVDVSRLAQALGGGGHAKSSGFTLEGHIEKTEKGWRII